MKKIFSLKGILCLLVLAVILLAGVIFVLFQKIKNENQNSSGLQNSIDLSTKQNQYVTSLEESLQNSSAAISEVNNSILSTDGDVTFIEQLEDTAKNNGLDIAIDSLSVEDIPNVTSDNLTSLDVRASAQGSWGDMMTFLTKLESMPFIMRIEKFDLTNSSDNPIGILPPPKATQNWQTTVEIRVLQFVQN